MGAKFLWFSIVVAGFGGFVASTVMGWSSPMIEKLQKIDDNPLGRPITETENSWLASISILGSCAGGITLGIVAFKIGRKSLLLLAGTIIFVFYTVMVFATSVWVMLLCRFSAGFGVGGILSTLPLYLAEIAEAKNRGMISTTMTIFLNGGYVYAMMAGPNMSYFAFHVSLACFPAVFVVAFLLFVPESPHYLIKTDRSKAREVLKRFRCDEDFEAVLDRIEDSIRNSSKVSFFEIIQSKKSLKTLLMGVGGFTFTQLIGSSIVISYTETLLKEAGGSISPKDGPVLINIVGLVASLMVPLYADRFPRKFLLIIFFAGIALSEIPLGAYFYLKLRSYDVGGITWLPLICTMMISLFFSVGIAPILLTILSEIYPPKIKNAVVSWLIAYNMGGGFLVTLEYNSLQNAIGMDYLLWLAAFFAILAVLFVKFCMIETRGKTLEEIQNQID